jgi:hypothetical protein
MHFHEKGILDPTHVKVPPCSSCLGYSPQGKKDKDFGTSSIHPKSSFHHKSYHTPKTYVFIPPPSSYKLQKHVTIHLPPSTLPPLLPTPNIPPSSLPPVLPTPNIPIVQYPYPFIHKSSKNPDHDQSMHTLSKLKAYTHSTKSKGFQNKNLDGFTHKFKNHKGPNSLAYNYKNSKPNLSKKQYKPIPSKEKSKNKMVWVPKQKEIKPNDASKSKKSHPSTSTSHSHSSHESHIPSHKKNKIHKNTKYMWVPKALHHPSPKKTSSLLPTPLPHQKLQYLSQCVQPLVMVPFHFTKNANIPPSPHPSNIILHISPINPLWSMLLHKAFIHPLA